MTLKKKGYTKKKKRVFDKKLVFVIGAMAVIVFGLLFYKVFSQSSVKFSMKAGIIDQLGTDVPNSEFNSTITGFLETNGFGVSYRKSDLVTVYFYNDLAKYDYGIIVLRAHSALRIDNRTQPLGILGVDLFTSEMYRNWLYDEEQKNGQLSQGEYLWNRTKTYFAITSKFIENLQGNFPKSIVIAMGCWSLKPGLEAMAQAFIAKGASAYIGWTDMVYPQDTDNETTHLLNMLLNQDYSIGYAVNQTRSYPCSFGTQTVETRLDFYPKSANNLTIFELVGKKPSATLSTVVYNEESLRLFFVTNIVKRLRGSSMSIVIMK